MRKTIFLITTLFLLLPAAVQAQLSVLGPIDADNGFPLWYQDDNGLSLGQCLESNQLCALPPAGSEFFFKPFLPIDFPPNFPSEFSYFLAEAFIPPAIPPTPLRRYDVGLEGGFLNEFVNDGDQVVFPFIRLRVDIPVAGDYRVTHPFGVEIYRNQLAGGSVRVDPFELGLTANPLDFQTALTGDFNCPPSLCDPATVLGPFLTSADPTNRDVVDPVTRNIYLTNPLTPAPVAGSPNNTNFVRVERVELDAQGNVTNVLEVVDETDQFFLFGKKSSTFNVSPRAILFPEQNVAPVFTDRTITITNMSTVAAPSIGQIAVSGPNVADFTIPPGDDGCSNQNLNAGEICTFAVRFSGLADGLARSATITIPSGAGEFTAETVAVSGTIDSLPPAVSVTFPAAGGPAPANMAIIAQFDDDMAPLTINGTTFVVETGSGPFAGVVSFDAVSNIAVFTPDTSLALGTLHTATIAGGAGGVTDTVGNPMQTDFIWSFTGAPPDLEPPLITTSNPATASSGFPNNAPLLVTFSEPMLGFTTAGAVQLSTAAGPVNGTVAFDAVTNAVIFTPAAPLAFGTEHTLTVAATVQDLAGNPTAAPFSATFRTNFRPDPPELVSPLLGAAGVAMPVTLQWTRPVDQDGDPLQFKVSVCNNASFIGAGPDCRTDILVAAAPVTPDGTTPGITPDTMPDTTAEVYYAGFGFMGLVFGLAGTLLAGRGSRRKFRLLFLALAATSGLFLYSCGGGGGRRRRDHAGRHRFHPSGRPFLGHHLLLEGRGRRRQGRHRGEQCLHLHDQMKGRVIGHR